MPLSGVSTLISDLGLVAGSSGLGGVVAGQGASASSFSSLRTSMSDLSTVMSNLNSGLWVTNADVSNSAAIAYSKLALSNSIVAGDLTSGCVTEAKIGTGAVTSAKIADGTIVAGDIGILPAAKVRSPANSISNNSTEWLSFTTELFKSGVTHSNSGTAGTSTDPKRLTIATAGVYLITGNIQFDAASGGVRALYIRKNGATTVAQSMDSTPTSSSPTYISATTIENLVVGDYLELGAYQTSGSVLSVVVAENASPVLGVTWLGKGI